MSENPESLGEIADRVLVVAERDEISVENLIDTLGSRSHFALILVISAAAATPLSGIPGVSVVCGLLIALIAAERIVRPKEIYLPGKLKRRSIDGAKVRQVVQKLKPAINWIDRHTHRRVSGLFKKPLVYVPLAVCGLSGLVMPFLEFIPFTSSIVAAAVLLISVSFVTRDGVIAFLAAVPYLAIALIAVGLL